MPIIGVRSPTSTLSEQWNSERCRRTEEVSRLCKHFDDVDLICERSYGLTKQSRDELFANTAAVGFSSNTESQSLCATQQLGEWTGRFISWIVGIVYGRWDIRHYWNDAETIPTPEPFESFAVFPPGIIGSTNENNAEVVSLRIDMDGIVPDDPDRTDDIVRRVREVLNSIWEGPGRSHRKGSL